MPFRFVGGGGGNGTAMYKMEQGLWQDDDSVDDSVELVADIDECSENGRICLNGDCMNAPGSYRCVCRRGYELSPDGAFCLGMFLHFPLKTTSCPGE